MIVSRSTKRSTRPRRYFDLTRRPLSHHLRLIRLGRFVGSETSDLERFSVSGQPRDRQSSDHLRVPILGSRGLGVVIGRRNGLITVRSWGCCCLYVRLSKPLIFRRIIFEIAAGPNTLPRERFSRVPSMFDSLEVKVLYPT